VSSAGRSEGDSSSGGGGKDTVLFRERGRRWEKKKRPTSTKETANRNKKRSLLAPLGSSSRTLIIMCTLLLLLQQRCVCPSFFRVGVSLLFFFFFFYSLCSKLVNKQKINVSVKRGDDDMASCLVLSPVLEAAALSRACYVLGGRVGGCGKLSGERPSEHDPRAHAERQGDGEPQNTLAAEERLLSDSYLLMEMFQKE
jgi:hypothetical protein